VFGAAGFLGSNLSERLLEKGHQVIGVDNFATSTDQNLRAIRANQRFEFVEATVSDSTSWPEFETLDYIYHLASPASPPKYQKLGLETLKANTVGTENLINLSIKHNARFLFASTSEIYGDPAVSPQSERYWGNVNTIGPRSVYDEAKRLGETLVSLFNREHGLDGAIIRIFNTYGPGMDPYDGRVVSSFIRQGLSSEPFSVFGDGSQTRSFCFVDDLIDGIVAMAESRQPGPINLGNPSEIDLLTLGETVAQVLGIKPKYSFEKLPEDDPKQRKPDITLAKELLNWEPKVSLAEGIERTAAWIKMSSAN
jgi:nucleoside-diphosphate-sugar epimerase